MTMNGCRWRADFSSHPHPPLAPRRDASEGPVDRRDRGVGVFPVPRWTVYPHRASGESEGGLLRRGVTDGDEGPEVARWPRIAERVGPERSAGVAPAVLVDTTPAAGDRDASGHRSFSGD